MMLDIGLNRLRDFLYGDDTWMGFGTGTTAATASDTALETEFFPDNSARETVGSKTKTMARKVRLQVNLLAGEANGKDITEFGVFDAVSGGNMYNRHVVSSPITKTSSSELNVQQEFEFSRVV